MADHNELGASIRARFDAVKHLGKFGPVDTAAREEKAWKLFQEQGMFVMLRIKNGEHGVRVPTEGSRVS